MQQGGVAQLVRALGS